MVTAVNSRDVALQATSPRILPVSLPTNVVVDFATITGTTKPADNATKNVIYRQASAPTSPINGDIWVDTSLNPNVVKTRVAGVWQSSATYTTNTTQLTDGADLGGTATWGGVTGTGKPSDYADVTTTILTDGGTSIVMTNAQLFKSASGTAGVFIGSGGLFGKDNGGNTTFSISGSTGAATFAGDVSTAGKMYAYGSNTTSGGTGAISGYSTVASSYGVVGTSSLFKGVGGFASAAGQAGVFGQNTTSGGTGVSGTASGSSSYAGYFNNSSGYGVYSTGWIESTKTIRSTGAMAPSSGSGVEILYTGGNGYVQSYDRSGSVYVPLYLSGSTVVLNGPSGSTTLLNTSGFAIDKGFGCNSKSAQSAYSVNAASTDLSTVIALCNQLRTALIACGITI